MSLKDLQLPSIASLRAIAALKNRNLAPVRPARIGLGFESAGTNQKSLLELQRQLGGPGRIALPQALRWLLDAMTGLSVLHRTLGFVHGELTPEHLVLGDDGIGRLVPVVRAHWVRGEERAPEGLHYLAPERLLGDAVDVRADVFGFGVLLWETLSARPFSELADPDSIVASWMSSGPPPVDMLQNEHEAWAAPLAGVAERATALDPARRFGTLAELKADVEGVAQRYLPSAAGMIELYRQPELYARSSARDSVMPESQRLTLAPPQPESAPAPTRKASPAAEQELRSDPAQLDAAAERLSRDSFASFDMEGERTTLRRLTEDSPPARKPHVNTLLGVPPPPTEPREASSPDSVTNPMVRHPRAAATSAPKSATAQRNSVDALLDLAPETPTRLKLTAPVGTPAPVISPPGERARDARAPVPETRPHVASSEPTDGATSEGHQLASISPLVTHRHVARQLAEPHFELVRPRKSRAALWALLGAAAAMAAFAARPWLARQIAASSDGLPDTFVPAAEAPADAAPGARPGESAAEASSAAAVIRIAPTPPAPPGLEGKASRTRFGAPGRHASSGDRPLLAPSAENPSATTLPTEPSPATSTTNPSVSETPPPPPAPKPKHKPRPRPEPEADRYGI